MPRAVTLPMAAMALAADTQLMETNGYGPVTAVAAATAAAVPVRASAHAAAMAELAAAAVNALELIIKRLRNMALMVILAVPVVPLASWARSMFTKLWPPQ